MTTVSLEVNNHFESKTNTFCTNTGIYGCAKLLAGRVWWGLSGYSHTNLVPRVILTWRATRLLLYLQKRLGTGLTYKAAGGKVQLRMPGARK